MRLLATVFSGMFCSGLLSTVALAQNYTPYHAGQTYVAGGFGGFLDYDVESNPNAAGNRRLGFDFEQGAYYTGALGYYSSGFRVEAEFDSVNRTWIRSPPRL